MRVALVLVVVACGSNDALVSDAMQKRIEQAWQGTWVLPSYEAIEIVGRDVKLFYNEHVDKGRLEIDAPCQMRLRFRDYSYDVRFALDGDRLWINTHGVRDGDTWYVCSEGVMAVVSPKSCKIFGERKSRCEQTATHVVLHFRDDQRRELAIHGNVLRHEGAAQEPLRTKSFDDAKVHSRERSLDGNAPSGEVIAKTRGCLTCHSTDGSAKVGPTFKDVWRTNVELADGTQILYDQHYVRESVRSPNARSRPGFPPSCVAFDETVLSEQELERLITFMKTLSIAR